MSRNEKNKSTTQRADKKWFIVMVIVLVCFVYAGAAWAKADTWLERQKLLASDGAAEDYFGYSVSISGDYAIMGAYGDDEYKGSAYIFRWDGTSWSEQQKLTASDGVSWSYFGWSVSISGDYAIVGAMEDDEKGDAAGSAYIFKRDGASWSQQAKITASDGAAYDRFGTSVSISGDYAIVGAYYDDDNGLDSGSAYIFKRDGTSWVEQQKLTASDGASEDFFGNSVSISGDYAIVGAMWDDANGTDSGSAYIFKRDGTSWSEQQKLTASFYLGIEGDNFGCSVSISGDYAIVGACNSSRGSAYIFRRDGTNWSQQKKLTASDGATGDYFGCSVYISSDLAIVGANGDDDNGSESGSAYIFKWDGTSWSQQAKLTASDVTASFGGSVSIRGDYAIVGAYGDAAHKGSAYAFRFSPRADLDDDCKVDFADFAIFADWWLYGTD